MQTDLILTRNLQQPPESLRDESTQSIPARHSTTIHLVDNPSSPHGVAIDQFYTSHQFPLNWSRTLLLAGAQAVMVLCNGVTAAVAWRIDQPFYIEEIDGTLDPGTNGDYYFGDFVSPAFRGRGLQRLLIRERLKVSYRTGHLNVTAMTREKITASLANYQAEGFLIACTLCKRRKFGLEWTRVCCTNKQTSSFRFTQAGWRFPFGLQLRLVRPSTGGVSRKAK